MSQLRDQYLALLGLRPGASRQQISSQYFFLLKRFPENLTKEQLEAKQRLQHAYHVLKKSYSTKAPDRVRRTRRRKARSEGSRGLTVGLGIALVLLLGCLLVLNSTNIKVKMVNHEVGDQLRWKDSKEAYGCVVHFESAHSFPTGLPGPAYEIRLNGTAETVWVYERIVEDRMEKWVPD